MFHSVLISVEGSEHASQTSCGFHLPDLQGELALMCYRGKLGQSLCEGTQELLAAWFRVMEYKGN